MRYVRRWLSPPSVNVCFFAATRTVAIDEVCSEALYPQNLCSWFLALNRVIAYLEWRTQTIPQGPAVVDYHRALAPPRTSDSSSLSVEANSAGVLG